MRSLALALLLTLLPAPAAAAGPPPAPSGDFQAPPDQTLVVTLPDGVVVAIEPGSRGRWFPKGKLPTETNGWTAGYHLVLQSGELDVRMPDGPKGAHAFLVQTRAGTLTDWRGKLHVMVHEDTTAAAIYEGALVVGSNGQGFPVYDGAGILMRKGIDPDKSRHIPPAPAWDADRGARSLLVEPTGARGTVGFSWKAVPGAASYRVVVARDPTMAQVLDVASTTDTTYALVERATAGGCWAQVRAVGPEGIVGEWSAPRSLRVVHFALPDGAVLGRDGTVVLPPNAAVTLDDSRGLEVAYSTSAQSTGLYWAPVTGPLRLPRDADGRFVHLRDSTLGQEAVLALVRRAVRADVEMTPRDPRPGDAIDVRVAVWDPSGRIDVGSETVKLAATLDLDPLPVAWRRAGSTWTARLRPPPTLRPTVVRVVATDATGTEIGRGFVEIPGSLASSK